MPIKIAFIGAGSLGFTRTLIKDTLKVPELRDTHFALHDIDPDNLSRVEQIVRKDVEANKLPAKVTATDDRREAVTEADFVVNCTRIGGLEAFETDIEIPLKYGIDQCVGDTLCAGGIMYGQRNVPQMLAFLRDMEAVAKPTVRMLNYANPMAINTWAALDESPIETIGLCHGVHGGWRQIATALGVLPDDNPDWQQRVEIVCTGINHQTWYTQVLLDGDPVSADRILKGFENHEHLSRNEKVRIDVLRRFGVYSTESNGHLSEYLPWYRKRPEEIPQWIGDSSWIDGETGGYLRVCTEGRNWFETDFPDWLDKAGQPIDEHQRSHEHGSYIIEAIVTGRPYRGHFNVRNGGIVKNLPADCIVESPGYVDRFGLNMTEGLELPLAAAATCQASINVQRMATRAAVTGDVTLLKQAVLHDPLSAAICSPEEIWQMVDEMLVAQAQWLPQYEANGSIREAEDRLAAHERNGTRVKLRQGWQGAARKKTRSVEELREAKEGSVLEADKAAASRARQERVAATA
jgi:alpha-galactosidase